VSELMVKNMEREKILTIMVQFLKVNMLMGLNKVKDNFNGKMDLVIKVIYKMVYYKDKVFLLGKMMKKHIKENLKII